MTTALPRPSTTGRHRAPESADEPRWASPADFRAAWMRIGRHAAAEPAGTDPFDWLGVAPAAG
ncbi:hypothetical protein [Blastococcus sp. TF02A-26]|uniref:hypothetical protein n=1 Tax=Blastococcus sp. TF02A-26 TaxID=2250577 RepID=UPI000DEBB368|nr:hypothetical protein [Blastococcus sp. TF02A-26]RBY86856.1 hypothetical protein DQ240_08635 [Blastococcus sp. TF02A-26]